MGLLTKEIEDALERYPLYSQDGKGRKAKIVCKFYLPGTAWTWYVLEGSRTEIDEAAANDAKIKAGPTWQLFGITCNEHDPHGEYGYFLLAELEAIAVKVPVLDEAGGVLCYIEQRVELDEHFTAKTLGQVDGLRIYED